MCLFCSVCVHAMGRDFSVVFSFWLSAVAWREALQEGIQSSIQALRGTESVPGKSVKLLIQKHLRKLLCGIITEK